MKNNNSPFLFICNDIVFDPAKQELPQEIDALIEGQHGKKLMLDGSLSDVVITKDDVNGAVQFIKERRAAEPNREFVIDYEHQTIFGGEAPAAGWWNDLKRIERNGLAVARAIISKWTPRGSERILNGEYRYISPVFRQNTTDDYGHYYKCLLYNLGLVNDPFLKNMMPLVANNFINQQNNINRKDNLMKEALKNICIFLGIAEDADEPTIVAKFNEAMVDFKKILAIEGATITAKDVFDYLTTNKPVLITAKAAQDFQAQVIAKLGLDAKATPQQALAMIVAAKAGEIQLATLQTKVQQLESTQFNEKFNLVIARGFAGGRIRPVDKADKEWLQTQTDWAKRDFNSFETYYCKTGPVVAPIPDLPNLNNNENPEDKNNPLIVAKAAQDFIATEKAAGRTVTTTDAVSHVMKEKGAVLK
jgi:phage I-like protein